MGGQGHGKHVRPLTARSGIPITTARPDQALEQTGHATEVLRASALCPREPAAELWRSAVRRRFSLMKVDYVPLLQVQRELHDIPRGYGRFKHYLRTIFQEDGLGMR